MATESIKHKHLFIVVSFISFLIYNAIIIKKQIETNNQLSNEVSINQHSAELC